MAAEVVKETGLSQSVKDTGLSQSIYYIENAAKWKPIDTYMCSFSLETDMLSLDLCKMSKPFMGVGIFITRMTTFAVIMKK